MATLTTHVLDSLSGTHASPLAVMLHRVDGAEKRTLVFATQTDVGGRISQEVPLACTPEECTFELVFATQAYFASRGWFAQEAPPIESVAVRFRLACGQARYHLPILVTPASATVACIVTQG